MRKATYWICQIAGWGLYSSIGVWMAASQRGWRPSILAGYSLFFLYSVGLTHALRYRIRRDNWLSLPLRRLFPRVALGSAIVSTAQTALIFFFNYLLEPAGDARLDLPALPWFWVGINGVTGAWTLLYVAAGIADHFRHAQLEALRLQLALKESELRALEAQVNPHFLFNCLNTIRGMIIENPAQAQEMVTRLADLLRYSLHRGRVHTVPLARELEAVSNYLALEEARFEDRLGVEFTIDPAASQVHVPTMMLQTLVENAVKHGIAQRPGGGQVSIRAGLENGDLVLAVGNPGSLLGPAAAGTQTGLRNVRERLRILYGDRARLTLANQDDDHVAATVTIPKIP